MKKPTPPKPPKPDDHHPEDRDTAMPSTLKSREIFWQNVMREMLTSLAMQRAKLVSKINEHLQQAEDTKPEAEDTESETEDRDPAEEEKDAALIASILESFDGRMAIVTSLGERIPIADITPLFACSIGGTSHMRALSEDVQCTVFQIRTPSGEVYTFPIQEIRGFHALTAQAMQELEASAAENTRGSTDTPFGFAAFTSLARELENKREEEEDSHQAAQE